MRQWYAYLPEVEHGRGAGANGQSGRSARAAGAVVVGVMSWAVRSARCCGWSGCAYLPGVVAVLAERGLVAGVVDEVAARGVVAGHRVFSLPKASAYRAHYLPGAHDFPLLAQRTPARRQRASPVATERSHSGD